MGYIHRCGHMHISYLPSPNNLNQVWAMVGMMDDWQGVRVLMNGILGVVVDDDYLFKSIKCKEIST